MNDFLSSRNFSLACAMLNAIFAINALSSGSYVFFIICSIFFGVCMKNYLNA